MGNLSSLPATPLDGVDGDPIDALVLSEGTTFPGLILATRPIGVLLGWAGPAAAWELVNHNLAGAKNAVK